MKSAENYPMKTAEIPSEFEVVIFQNAAIGNMNMKNVPGRRES
jgi:hypothetical protein